MYGENMYGENINREKADTESKYAGNGYGESRYAENRYAENSYGENRYGERNSAGEKREQICGEGNNISRPPVYGNHEGMGYVTVAPGPKYGEKLEKMLSDFRFYGVGCILYGILFAFCLYPGFCGISVPVLSVVTMGILLLIFRRMDIKAGKSTLFYFGAWGMLSVSSCLTGSRLLTGLNTLGMLLLFCSFMLSGFCDTGCWGFGKYLLQICRVPFVSLAYWGCPFQSAKRYLAKKEKEAGKSSRGKYVWMGVGLSLPVLIVILCLLSSADAVFERLLEKILEGIRLPAHPFYMILLLTAGSIGAYGLLACFVENREDKKAAEERRRWEPLIGISFLSVLTVVYILFSVIQVSYLFLGSFALPEGYTYASYAREGFFQLLFVCLINLTILLTCITWFREHAVLKALLTIFSGCTLIMDLSSAMRMVLYVQVWQLTFLRLLVLWALIVIDILLVGCIITVYKNRFPLFRYTMVTVTVCYLIFSLAKPDYVIARYNLTHDNGELGEVDLSYLCRLSNDAIPALEEEGILGQMGKWDDEYNSCYSQYHLRIKLEDYREMGIRDFNVSDYRAGKILEKYEAYLTEK